MIFCVFRFFQFHPDSVNFFEAQDSCETFNGRLAEPRNQEQFDVISQFKAIATNYWLGGNDFDIEGLWVWNSDNSTIDLTQFFNRNEPNNARNDEQCLELQLEGLNDETCTKTRPFLCELGALGDVPVCPA